MNSKKTPLRQLAFALASISALALAGWLASIPGQAEDSWTKERNTQRKPVTCTDAAGIIYERGTPGFERCLSEMQQAAEEQAAKAEDEAKKLRKKTRTEQKTPSTSITPSPSPSPVG